MNRQPHVEQLNRPPSGNDIRSKLLAGIPVTERRLQLAGISTSVLEGGDGPPVVLLHGPGEYAAKWMRVIPNLAKTHTVIAPDLPGHGTSAAVDGILDIDRVLMWLGDLIERTCTSPPALVGHVLGGAIAARFAIEQGDSLSHLVLVDALGLAPFQPAPAFGLALNEFIAHPTTETHDGLWQQCAYNLDGLREQMGYRWVLLKAYNLDRARMSAIQPTQHSLMEQFGMPSTPSTDLAEIDVPTTLIWGRHDLATDLQVAEAASTRYGWPLHVIDHCADDPPLEQPEAFLQALHIALGTLTGEEVDA